MGLDRIQILVTYWTEGLSSSLSACLFVCLSVCFSVMPQSARWKQGLGRKASNRAEEPRALGSHTGHPIADQWAPSFPDHMGVLTGLHALAKHVSQEGNGESQLARKM